MKGGLDTLVLRLTNRCNLACGYCYAGSGPAGEDLSPERAAEAVALACPPGGVLRIQFTGGEPLLRWDTAAKVLDFGRASGRRFHAAIQTNGTLLTPALCRELRARRVAVGVSLDGVGPDNAARRTPEGEPSFQATARGLQTLAAAGMAANLTAVVSAGSVRGLDRLLDFALWCGNVHGVGLDLVRPQGRGAGVPLPPGAGRGFEPPAGPSRSAGPAGPPGAAQGAGAPAPAAAHGLQTGLLLQRPDRALPGGDAGRPSVALLRPGRGGGVPPGYAGRGDGPAAESLPRAGTAGGMRPLSRLRPVRRGLSCRPAGRALPPGLPDAPEDAGARLPAGGEIGVVEYVENRVSR